MVSRLLRSRRLVLVLTPAALLAGGCADLMARSTIAPEWFQAKAVEVKGEGYPDLSEVPETRTRPRDWNVWMRDSERLSAAATAVDNRVNAAGDPRTEEEIRASAAQLRALLGSDEPTPDEQPS